MKWLTLFPVLFFSFCHSSEISVNEIRQYAKTDQAIRSNVMEFFDRRMKNKPRKALVGNWEILHEDEENVYYGYPRFKRFFSDERVVEQIYYLPVAELKLQFPAYKELTGSGMRLTIYKYIEEYRKKKNDNQSFTLSGNDWSANLKENTIEITATTRSYDPNKNIHSSRKFGLILNKNDLKLFKLEEK